VKQALMLEELMLEYELIAEYNVTWEVFYNMQVANKGPISRGFGFRTDE
jgi:hypothetical protein